MIKTYADVNTSGEFNMYTYTCDSGYQYVWYGHDMDAGLHTQYCDCRVANNLRRALNSTPQHYTMFDLLAEYIYIPITGCMMVLVLSGIWLAAMKRFGQTFIWLSLILIFSIMIAMAVLLFSYEATDAAVVILVLAGLLLAYLAFRREMINRAGKTLETAAKGLWKNVSVFIILGPIECVFIGYIFLWMNAWTMSFKTYEVNSVTCEIDLSGSSYRDMWIVSFLMLWVSFYINHVKVNVVGATLAAWAFGQKNEYSWDVPKQAIRWSFWESSPTLALTSLICMFLSLSPLSLSLYYT